ncbi:hypothetical protein J4447_04310 [Candidatus Pacearchaeota archaeon]|nr:hypothetical protein [Candidatus Pacearchaeota archaeon]
MAEKLIGEVSDFFAHVNAAAIKLAAALKVGDSIRVKGGETDITQAVESMQINRKPVQSAKKGDEVGILLKEKARKGYKVYKL